MSQLSYIRAKIDAVDLRTTIERLVFVEKWKEQDAILASELYRKYLYLKIKYGNEYELPPSYEIDEVWHAHILHTEDYMIFCNDAFGHYLHHHPHRRDGKLSDQQISKLFETQTQKLYHQEFGEYIYAIKITPLRKRVVTVLNRLIMLIRNPTLLNSIN